MFQTFLILFSFSLFPLISNNILFFKFKYEDLNTTNDLSIFQSLFSNHLITTLEIGNPIQKINVYISLKDYEFYLTENKQNETSYNYEKSKFSKQKSKLLEFYDSPYLNGIYFQDQFNFNSTNGEIIKTNFSFILAKNLLSNVYSTIGLSFHNPSDDFNINFMNQLKNLKIISNLTWNIKYINEKENILSIGKNPDEYDLTYKKENLHFTKIAFNDMYSDWNLYFDNIYFNNKENKIEFKGEKICEINFERALIKGPFEYKKLFFESVFNNNDCQEISYFSNLYYVCNKNTKISELPNIYLKSRELNYTFELNYNDLFIEINDKLYFLVYFNNFDNKNFKYWILGKPFLKKFHLIFENEKKLIGFYQINTYNYFIYFQIVLISILTIIFIVLLILFIKSSKYSVRKRRKNEVEEDYDYSTRYSDYSLLNPVNNFI